MYEILWYVHRPVPRTCSCAPFEGQTLLVSRDERFRAPAFLAALFVIVIVKAALEVPASNGVDY